MAGDDDEMFMTRRLNVTSKTTEQHLIVRSLFQAHSTQTQMAIKQTNTHTETDIKREQIQTQTLKMT